MTRNLIQKKSAAANKLKPGDPGYADESQADAEEE